MKRLLNFVLCLYLVSCFLVIPSLAGVIDPSRIGLSARSIGMGRTTINQNEVASEFINPAYSSTLDTGGLTSMQTTIAEDAGYNFVGLGVPAAGLNLGFGLLISGTSGIVKTSTDSNGRFISVSSSEYYNNLIMLVLGQRYSPNISLGETIKIYSRSLGVDGGSATGYDLDFGLMYQAGDDLNLGICLQNLLPFNLAALAWTNGTKEDLPMILKGGVNFAPLSNLRLASDLDVLPDSPLIFRSGLEWDASKNLIFRGGFEYLPTGSLGYATNFTLGVGLKISQVDFDYAYFIDGTLPANSTHYFSLSYLFPDKAVDFRPILPAQADEFAQKPN